MTAQSGRSSRLALVLSLLLYIFGSSWTSPTFPVVWLLLCLSRAVCGGASISCARPPWEVVDTYVWVDINSMSRRCFPLGAVFRAVNCIHDAFSLETNYLECFSGNFPGLVAVSRRFGVMMLMLADGGFPLRRDDRDEYRITDCSPQPRPIALLHMFLCFLHSRLSSDTAVHVSR